MSAEHHDSKGWSFSKGWQQPIIALLIIVFIALIGIGIGVGHSGYAMSKPKGHCCGDKKECAMDGKKEGACCKDGKKEGGACCKDGEHKDGGEHHEGGEHH